VSNAGIRLGSFLLERPIARGGMAEVWRGVHVGEQMPAAVKVLTGPRAREEAFVRALQNEISAVARLDHPGIIVLYDRGEVTAEAALQSGGRLTKGSPWFAMEMCSHGALSPRRFPLPWRATRLLLLSLLDALAHAHARGVVHRDLKPGNILLSAPDDPRPGLKLSDFGIAQALEQDGGPADAHSGTPRYMAPEQFAGRARAIGPWTDLYALGCIAYQLATGAPPFAGDPLRLSVAHSHDAVPSMRHVDASFPAGYEAWVLRLLEKEPQHRFRVAADAAWALLQLAPDDEPTGDSGSWADALRSLRPRPLYPDESSSARGTAVDDTDAHTLDGERTGPAPDPSSSTGQAAAPHAPPDPGDVAKDVPDHAAADPDQPTSPGRGPRISSQASLPSRSFDDRFVAPALDSAALHDEDPFAQMLTAGSPADDVADVTTSARRFRRTARSNGPPATDTDDDNASRADDQPRTETWTWAAQGPWTELVALHEQRVRRDVDVYVPIGGVAPTRSRASELLQPLVKARAAVEPPPLPPSWRRPDEDAVLPGTTRTRRLLGAGLGLFGLRQPPFVGRLVERTRLWSLLRDAHDKPEATWARDAVIVVRGPAGVGRSRLCAWFAERAAEVGAAHALIARHAGSDGAFAGLVGALLRHARATGLRDGALRVALEAAWPALEGDDVAALARFFEDPARLSRPEAHALLRRALHAIANDRPVVLVLEDAHSALDAVVFAAWWATGDRRVDDSAPERCGVVTLVDVGDEAVAEQPQVAFATAALCAAADDVLDVDEGNSAGHDRAVHDRAVDDRAAHDRAVHDRAVHDRAAHDRAAHDRAAHDRAAHDRAAHDRAADATVAVLPLRPLPERDHRRLVEGLLGLEPGLIELVARRSAGSPRFAVELVGDLVGRDVLEPAPAGFALRTGAAVEVPDDVHAAWSTRLHRLLATLPADARVCLELGALLGRDGDEREWRDVCVAAGVKDAHTTIAAVTDALERARFLVVDHGVLRFASASLRESMVRLAHEAGRAEQGHRVIADVLQRAGRTALADRERCARHLLQGGRMREGLPMFLQVTAATLSGQGSGPALALVDEIFAALDRHAFVDDDPLRLQAMALRARALIEAGRYGEGVMWARLVGEGAPVVARLWAWRALTRAALLQGDLEGAVERYRALLTLAEQGVVDVDDPERTPVEEAIDDALLGLADGHYYRGQLAEAAATLQRALSRAEARNDDAVVAGCLWAMAFVALWRGDEREARALLERQQKIARRAGLRVLGALGRNALGDVERFAGARDAARVHYEEAERQLVACGSGKARVAALNRALCDVEDNIDSAVARVEQLLPDLERAGERGLLAACHGVLALGALKAGDASATDAHCAALLEPLKQGVRDGELAVIAEQIAVCAARLGDSWRAGLAAKWAREVWQALGRTDRAPL
jgi:serine/threonine protein kinase/tetratricopeptide (TPR) repeat protein